MITVEHQEGWGIGGHHCRTVSLSRVGSKTQTKGTSVDTCQNSLSQGIPRKLALYAREHFQQNMETAVEICIEKGMRCPLVV